MRKVVNVLVLIPLAVLFIVFAVANRQLVTVSFDPFNSANPAIGITLPLFVALIAVTILGVMAGSLASWFRHRHWRREARRFEAEARTAQAELAASREREAAASAPAAEWSGPVPNYPALPRDNPAALL